MNNVVDSLRGNIGKLTSNYQETVCLMNYDVVNNKMQSCCDLKAMTKDSANFSHLWLRNYFSAESHLNRNSSLSRFFLQVYEK